LLDAEHDNIRETLQRLIDGSDGHAAIRLAGALGTYWHERGHWGEGRRWLLHALALTAGERSVERARALLALAESTSSFAGIATTRAELEEAVEIAREQGNTNMLAITLVYLSFAYGWQQDQVGRRRAFSEARAIADTIDSAFVDASLGIFESLGRVMDGELAAAHADLVEGAAVLLGLGDDHLAARSLMYAGNVARLMGELCVARTDLERSIELTRGPALLGTRAHAAMTLAQVAMELGDPDASSRFRECTVELDRIGDDRCLAVCERTLGSLAFDDDRPDEALAHLRASLDGLARYDERSLAVAFADLARIHARRGNAAGASRLLGTARMLADRSGLPLSAAERGRLDAAAAVCAPVEVPEALDLDAALTIARAG
jgi:hypothetical protein